MGPIHAMNFAAFDLNLLRVFDALMRERSVSRAGEQIGLSQPAVSAALGRLRDMLGDRLFVRQGNDMCPTPRAETLAPGIREALASLELLLGEDRDFDPRAQDRTFTLLGGDFFSTMVMPELASRIARQSPRIALRFLDSARGEVERFLKDDVIDVALERPLDVPEWVDTEHLFHSPFKIIVAHSHPLVAGLDPAAPCRSTCSVRCRGQYVRSTAQRAAWSMRPSLRSGAAAA
jgi:DNA-binding transcriptional LysR family regulator